MASPCSWSEANYPAQGMYAHTCVLTEYEGPPHQIFEYRQPHSGRLLELQNVLYRYAEPRHRALACRHPSVGYQYFNLHFGIPPPIINQPDPLRKPGISSSVCPSPPASLHSQELAFKTALQVRARAAVLTRLRRGSSSSCTDDSDEIQ